MRIDLAMLRRRAAQLLEAHPIWRGSALRAGFEPALPTCTPRLFKLAQIAVGDADSAAVLTADVLARHLEQPADEDTLVRTLVERLPQGWLSWPGECGPGEWLPLGVRRELADRLLSVLGEWTSQERIGLALYLLYDVRRDDLDSLLGTQGLGERIGRRINSVGVSLGLIKLSGLRDDCAERVEDLVDADDPQIGTLVRRHTLGCDACRQRVAGLRRTTQILRTALTVFFRSRPPLRLGRMVLEQRRQQQRLPLQRWPIALAAVLLLLLLNNARQQPAVSTARLAPVRPPDAAELLSRALDRFAADAPRGGVLHERIRFQSHGQPLILERWYDDSAQQRLRITVRQPGTTVPILDLSTDGSSHIAYQLDRRFRAPTDAIVNDPDTAALLPLLRQLPFTGSFGDGWIDQRSLDLTLLAQAQRAGATLLGTTGWQDRAAVLLSSTTADGSRLILTLDQATASLLEARVMPAGAGSVGARAVWQADLFEIVTRQQLPAGVFELSPRKQVLSKINPRQFMFSPLANMDITTALSLGALPVPQQLPEPPLLAYLRGQDRRYNATLQMYESAWSSLAIVTPRQASAGELAPLDQRFAHGSYRQVNDLRPGTTVLEFSMGGAEGKRMRLYLWHGLLSDAERTALARRIIDSLVLTDSDSAMAQQLEFAAPAGRVEAVRLVQGGSTGSGQAFIRRKSRQLLQLELSPLDTPAFLER